MPPVTALDSVTSAPGAEAAIVWRKTREFRNHHFDSTICGANEIAAHEARGTP